MEAHDLTLWLTVYPEPDAPHIWTAHWLDIDLVTCGDNAGHALEMALEALAIFLGDNLTSDVPFRTHRAPEEDWRRLEDILANGQRARETGDAVLVPANVGALAANFRVEIGDRQVSSPVRVGMWADEAAQATAH